MEIVIRLILIQRIIYGLTLMVGAFYKMMKVEKG